MSTKVSSSLFKGTAKDILGTADAYVADKAASATLTDSLKSGMVSSTSGIPGLDSVKSGVDSLGLTKTVDKMTESIKSGQGFGQQDVIKSITDEVGDSEIVKGLEKRAKQAKEAIGGAFPFELSKACIDIIEMFALGLLGGGGFDLVRGGASHYVASTAVQCAMDAFGMLLSIPGMKGKLKNEVVDIEATSAVLAGLVGTLVEYGMQDDIEEVLKLSPSTLAVNRAVGKASGNIISKGNINTTNWMIDKIGMDDILAYNPNAVQDVIRNYDTSQSPNTPPEYFIETLAKMNPSWAKTGDTYYLSAFEGASPSAMAAFEKIPDLNDVSMIADVQYFLAPTLGYPSPVDVTRNIYPSAIGTAPFIPTSDRVA